MEELITKVSKSKQAQIKEFLKVIETKLHFITLRYQVKFDSKLRKPTMQIPTKTVKIENRLQSSKINTTPLILTILTPTKFQSI